MNVADLMAQAEARARRSHYTAVVVAVIVSLLLLSITVQVIYHRGVDAGRTIQRDSSAKAALVLNAKRLKADSAWREQTKARVRHADSVAQVARADADAARRREAATRARLTIVGDSAVAVDDKPPSLVDPVIVSELRNADIRRRLDSLALATADEQIATRDREKAALEQTIKDYSARDLDHIDYERTLSAEIVTTGRAKFWTGVKTGVVGTVAVIGGLLILLH